MKWAGENIIDRHTLAHNHGQNEEKVLANLPTIEECVNNIAAAMQMSDPAVSYHLRTLKSTGLIVSRREGKEIYYKLADTQVAEHIHHMCEKSGVCYF